MYNNNGDGDGKEDTMTKKDGDAKQN